MADKECFTQRLTQMEDRLETHHETLQNHDRRLTDLTTSLHENTELTRQTAETSRQTAANTAELVELFKGAKVFRKFFLWVSPLIIIVYSGYQWMIGGK